jgi:hypothetical protein
MQRRQFIQNLLTASIYSLQVSSQVANPRRIDPLFLLDLLNPQIPLPDHLITPLQRFLCTELCADF